MSVLALAACCSQSMARDPRPSPSPARGHDRVEMFSAVEEGLIEVDMIGLDATKANLIFKNKTDKPLSIHLPEVFAGVPVLAQDIGGADAGGTSGAQATGGGGGIGGIGGGGGFFNVAPKRTGKLGVETICLEHGKRDPNPKIDYEIKPLATVTSKPEVIELCRMLGRGEIPQNSAQAAAWHLANGLSWQQLANKDRYRSQFTGRAERFFSLRELQFAQRIVAEATKRAEETPKDPPPSQVVPVQQVRPVSQEGLPPNG